MAAASAEWEQRAANNQVQRSRDPRTPHLIHVCCQRRRVRPVCSLSQGLSHSSLLHERRIIAVCRRLAALSTEPPEALLALLDEHFASLLQRSQSAPRALALGAFAVLAHNERGMRRASELPVFAKMLHAIAPAAARCAEPRRCHPARTQPRRGHLSASLCGQCDGKSQHRCFVAHGRSSPLACAHVTRARCQRTHRWRR